VYIYLVFEEGYLIFYFYKKLLISYICLLLLDYMCIERHTRYSFLMLSFLLLCAVVLSIGSDNLSVDLDALLNIRESSILPPWHSDRISLSKYDASHSSGSFSSRTAIHGYLEVEQSIDNDCDGARYTNFFEFGVCINLPNTGAYLIIVDEVSDGLYNITKFAYDEDDCSGDISQVGSAVFGESCTPAHANSGNYFGKIIGTVSQIPQPKNSFGKV
jgi:hypothetical protein